MTPDLVHPNQAMAVVAAMAVVVAIKAVADTVAAVGEATAVAVAVAIKAAVGSKGTVITRRVAKVEVEVDTVHKAAATGNLATELPNKGWKPEVQDPHKVGPGGIMKTQSSSETWVNPISHKLTQFSRTLVLNQWESECLLTNKAGLKALHLLTLGQHKKPSKLATSMVEKVPKAVVCASTQQTASPAHAENAKLINFN